MRWIALLAVVFVAACGPGQRGPVSTNVESATLTQPLTRLVFTNLSAGDLTVKRAEGTTVHLTRRLQWRGDKPPQYTETWEGQTLRISYTCPLINCSIDYTVELPENVELQAKASSGDVDVSGMAATVGVETSSGDVKLTQVKGAITVHATSGDVRGTGLAAAQASITTSSGEVNLGFAVAPQAVTVHTTSGDATVVVPPRDTYRVAAKTTSGDQNVTVDRSESASRKIDAECTSGDVTIKYGSA